MASSRHEGKRWARALICMATCAAFLNARAAETWHVKNAAVRFTVKLASAPTHESAGYFVQLPDGGILPKTYAQTVVTADGAVLKSFLFWPNAQTGAGVLFEGPSTQQDVFIYVAPGRPSPAWTPASGLTPSALLCTHSGCGAKSDAQELARLGPADATVHYQNRAGCPPAPISVPGDLSGRTGACAIYMLAYISITDPGKTWIAPVEFSGKSEVLIDGKAIIPEKRIAKPGGTGAWMDLAQGMHRLEIFSWSTGPAGPNGLMTLMWKTPNSRMDELGGSRPSDLPFPGTSMWESRRPRGEEIVRSGQATIARAEAQDGRPLARIKMTAIENFWVGDEKPLTEYELAPEEPGNPPDTRYEWSFGGDAKLTKPLVHWLFLGEQENLITLTASAGGKQSSCALPFFPFTTKATSLNEAACRENFRRAALDMLEAYPADRDPTANWTASHWNNFFRVMEIDKGRDLLLHIFRVRWATLGKKLSPERRQTLEDIFLDFLPRINPGMAVKQAETLEKQARDPHEAGMMQILRAEIYMYYLADVDSARKILESAAPTGSVDDISEWARIRLGDLNFLTGNLDEATRLYGEVQNRAQKSKRYTAGSQSPQTSPEHPLGPGLAGSKAELKAQREPADAKSQPPGGRVAAAGGASAAQWKVNALLDAAAAENVKSLIAQNFLMEAKQALREWERQFPLSKISGDYVLQEARFYMAVQDWRRAHATLKAYCEQVDASSFLPPAAQALLECKLQLNEPNEETVKFCEKMKKKLEFHPAGQDIDTILHVLKQNR